MSKRSNRFKFLNFSNSQLCVWILVYEKSLCKLQQYTQSLYLHVWIYSNSVIISWVSTCTVNCRWTNGGKLKTQNIHRIVITVISSFARMCLSLAMYWLYVLTLYILYINTIKNFIFTSVACSLYVSLQESIIKIVIN